MAFLVTQKELSDLQTKKDKLLKRKNISHTNSYGDNAYRYDLSPSEYMEISREIEELSKKISNAVVVPSININSRFTVEMDGNLLNMLMSVNHIDVDGLVCCTCDSRLGKHLIDKKVGDIIAINTPDNGEKTYKVISIQD